MTHLVAQTFLDMNDVEVSDLFGVSERDALPVVTNFFRSPINTPALQHLEYQSDSHCLIVV